MKKIHISCKNIYFNPLSFFTTFFLSIIVTNLTKFSNLSIHLYILPCAYVSADGDQTKNNSVYSMQMSIHRIISIPNEVYPQLIRTLFRYE